MMWILVVLGALVLLLVAFRDPGDAPAVVRGRGVEFDARTDAEAE
jgi:hypothetical protein